MRWIAVACLLAVLPLGCAGHALRRARADDTPAAYHRFLRHHGGSRLAEEARQRLEIARLRRSPTAAAYRAFLERWPRSPLLPELRRAAQEALFAAARARGTVDAYRAFLAELPDSDLAPRARGNLAFLEADGFGGEPAALRTFARRHPESDHAAEARRSAEATAARARTGFRRAGFVIELAGAAHGRERLVRAFSERAAASLRSAGVELVGLSGPDDPRAAGFPARLTIRHVEGPVGSKLAEGRVSSGGIEASTRVELRLSGSDTPLWSRTTRLRSPGPAPPGDTPIVFAPGSQRYWRSFFVPVASWDTSAAVRTPLDFEEPVVAVATRGTRAFLLLEDGSLRGVDLSDPERPWTFVTFRRPAGPEHFEGLRALDAGVAVFGQDGIEVFELVAEGARRVRKLDRAAIGSVLAVEEWGGALFAAGSRGLWRMSGEGRPQLLLDRPVHSLALTGGRLLFSVGGEAFVATPAQLDAGRVAAVVSLPPGFRPSRARASGASAVLIGDGAVVRLDLSRSAAPRVTARFDASRVGPVSDAVFVGGRLVLLGERGLLVPDATGSRVLQSADLRPRERLAVLGRHVVAVGGRWLQVADAAPLVAPQVPAAPP